MSKEREQIQLAIDELVELRNSVVEKLYEMRTIIRQLDPHGSITERATSYWLPNTITNLTDDHEWMSKGSMVNFNETISELEDIIANSEDDEKQDKELEEDPIFYHQDDCDCTKCDTRRQPGGLDHDPTEIVET